MFGSVCRCECECVSANVATRAFSGAVSLISGDIDAPICVLPAATGVAGHVQCVA